MTHLVQLLNLFFAITILHSITIVFVVSSQQLSKDEIFYSGFKNNNNLTVTGVAKIEKNGILKLTNDTSRLIGHAFYEYPLEFKNSSTGKIHSFSTTFAFIIVPEYPKLGGHGLAFTIVPSKNLNALPSQYLGLLNASNVGNFSNHIFAVEFDTVQDFEFGDINDNHVGIDMNSLVSNASAAASYYADGAVGFTKQDLNLKGGKPILAWVEYDSDQEMMNVTLSPNSNKPKLPLLSFKVDLSLVLEDYMYVGFSSSTGLLASSHYVLGWSFSMNGQPHSLDLGSLPSLPGQSKNNHMGVVVGASLASVVLAILAVLLLGFFVARRLSNADVIEDWEHEIGPHRYAYGELKKATGGFCETRLLGRGGFGSVYRGVLPDSKIQVAVKRISNESKQGLKEYVAEIASIGRLRHRNLVQLGGWCRRGGEFLLVYDYMANGSLDNFLFDQPKVVLNWEQRFKIIKDVASGLLYLHEGYEQVVVHRDVKASNVLLDSELNGRLGDFGLARLYEHGANPSTTKVVGTLGYLAPELPRTGKATTSSDVFAFGALLLEVVCGRRPIDPKSSPEYLVLVDWVWDNYREGRLLNVVDPKLSGLYSVGQVVMVLKLGIMCSHNSAIARPSMRQVTKYLEEEDGLPQNLRNPGEHYTGVMGMNVGFEDYLHSLGPSSVDRMSGYSYSFNGDGGTSLPTSPYSILHVNGQTR